MSVQSQLDPLPSDLPFRIVSKTIGRGAYASIKKAIPLEGATPVFAVKFIHKAYAVKHGRVTPKQIAMEVTLHAHVGQHQNVIEFFASGEDPVWRWIAMEYAEGGDLFDKIEADVGVSEDIAHFYFSQLMSGVAWMHSKGVGHRDIKPENILLSSNGDLKIADFGLATLFVYKGKRKESSTMCGSPPYIAPEVISCSGSGTRSKAIHGGYAGDRIDIWSCGVVLFVLLVGNTPWDQPTAESYEYTAYSSTNGKSSTDELWQKPPPAVLSLLRGMMKIDPSTRYTSQEVRRHPWFTRSNPYLSSDGSGRSGSPIHLATKLLESLKIDMSQEPAPSSQPHAQHHSVDSMDIDDIDDPTSHRFAATQPDTPLHDLTFDFDPLPAHIASASATAHDRFGASSSQPIITTTASSTMTPPIPHNLPSPLRSRASHLTHSHPNSSLRHPTLNTNTDGNASLADLPSMSQFSQNPSLPLTLTQHAQRFQDIVPAHSLTRFLSHLPRSSLLSLISEVLHNLGIPCPPPRELSATDSENSPSTRSKGPTWIRIKTVDSRKCPIAGDIVIESTGILKDGYEGREAGGGEEDEEGEFLECRFVKVKGDPVEWRRLFKKVCLAGKEGVWAPEGGD